MDVLLSKKDGSRMLLIEDDGGGMNPDRMRQCMSLGYSTKSKLANTIGQYGNGFKTSTMRLGADVIVFSRSAGNGGDRSTQSIGLLSYTFLRSTRKEDIVVPMVDFKRVQNQWEKLVRSSESDWTRNLNTIVQWSPYLTEKELMEEFNLIKGHGTRIIVYNLWEDDEGQSELDFHTDPYDIQLRGVNRDERKIQMAKQFPNSMHFLTYQHSLRSYASIIYLRLPHGFRMILRGKDVEHHNIVNDMMMTEQITYKPTAFRRGLSNPDMVAVVTIGFVKDAKDHIDMQGFNVYHKNRLIKPFWRVWNAAGSNGRGVIGLLEADFVGPAHDKQGFERTTVLSRLEAKLVQMQKTYWSNNCHKIGYAPIKKKLAQIPSQDKVVVNSLSGDQLEAVSSKQRSGVFSKHTNTEIPLQLTSFNANEMNITRIPLTRPWDGMINGKRSASAVKTVEPLGDLQRPKDVKGSAELAQLIWLTRSQRHDSRSFNAVVQPQECQFMGKIVYPDHMQHVVNENYLEPLSCSITKVGGTYQIPARFTKQVSEPKGTVMVDSVTPHSSKVGTIDSNTCSLKIPKEEIDELKTSSKEVEAKMLQRDLELQSELGKNNTLIAKNNLLITNNNLLITQNSVLLAQVEEYKQKLKVAEDERVALLNLFINEKELQETVQESLRKKLKETKENFQKHLQMSLVNKHVKRETY